MSSRRRPELPKQSKDREPSPERTRVWTEPKAKSTERKVPVVYYLSRNGHLEHPHFMEVSLSSPEGLYLRDVITRLNILRGKGMASMYSWSSKRSYKNGFVWHDLSEEDFIYPALGQEYVLKGSELLRSTSPGSEDTPTSAASSSSSDRVLEIPRSVQDDSDTPFIGRKKTPWNSLDLTEYKVYKTESTAETALKAADASTQTDDRRQWKRAIERAEVPNNEEIPPTELGRDEISPPPSSSSPETLETLIKADGRGGIVRGSVDDPDRAAGSYPSGITRASAVLMHLISCGSISVKDHGFSMVSQYRSRLPSGGTDQAVKDTGSLGRRTRFPATRLEEKEYFSGSLIETKKKAAAEVAEDFPSLKRSSSYNADRSSKLDLVEKEIDGVRAKCIPRKPKQPAGKKEANAISRSTQGSKRITVEPPN